MLKGNILQLKLINSDWLFQNLSRPKMLQPQFKDDCDTKVHKYKNVYLKLNVSNNAQYNQIDYTS